MACPLRRETPVVNDQQRNRFADALGRLCDDTELLQEMASVVVDDAAGRLDQLRDTLRVGDLGDAAYRSHQLRGMLSTFETGYPVSELQEVINAARVEQLETARRCFETVEPALRELIDEVAALKARHH